MVRMDSARALWVFDQAFRAALSIPESNTSANGPRLQHEIIMEEARLDRARAVDHALQMASPTPDDNSELNAPRANEKLATLVELMRGLAPGDPEDLFQSLAPALVREDEYFDATANLIQQNQASFPLRAEALFSLAMGQFGSSLPKERSIQSFIAMTTFMANSSPSLAESAAGLIVKKADELDVVETSPQSATTGLSNNLASPVGSHHLAAINQLMPVMSKINPSRAADWSAQIQDRRNVSSLNQALNPPSMTYLGPATQSGPSARRDRGARMPRGGDYSANPSAIRPRNWNPQDPNAQPVMGDRSIFPASQPSSAFSVDLNRELNAAQTDSHNDSTDYSKRLQAILPKIQTEGDARAKAAAFAQIALTYFQLGARSEGEGYLRESIREGEEGDSLLVRASTIPTIFFVSYSATSNAISKIAPMYPQEAVAAVKWIGDVQLRFRVMIDSVRSLHAMQATMMTPAR